jgi:uncharacterized membrane protein
MTLNRLARWTFGSHLVLIAFSTTAMVTILAGPPGPWLLEEPNATVMRLSFRFAGPTYVTLGFLCALAVLWSRLGGRDALRLATLASAIALGAELTGTWTGLPFGEYHYTPLLGYRVLGLVPFPIPISWFYMLAGCLVMVARLRPASDTGAGRWRWALLAGLLLLAWDVAMDPAMVRTSHWIWGEGRMFREAGLPAWLLAFFTRDAFYGMPLSNWFGWLLTGTLVARAMLWLVPPTRVASALGDARVLIALYLVNGIMPVALCMRDRMWWAAVPGALAMLVPALLALWRPTPARASLDSLRQQPA